MGKIITENHDWATDIVLISDIHLGVHNSEIEWTDNIIDYFDNFFIPYIKSFRDEQHMTPLVVIAGDLFENRQQIDINVLNVGMDILEKIGEHAYVYLCVGNHDIYRERDISVNSLRAMKGIKNVTLIDRPTVIHIAKGHRICLLPWMITHKEEMDFLTEHKDDAEVFVMHSEIKGMKMDNGRPITGGVDPKCLGKKGVIYSGHIHTRQTSRNVTYLGCPYHMKRSDIGNIKGIYNLHVDESTGELMERFKENDYSPRLVSINLMDILEKPLGDVLDMMHNNYVDLTVPKRYKKEAERKNIADVFSDAGAKNITIRQDNTEQEKKAEEKKKEGETDGDTTIRGIFTRKITSMDLDEKSVDSLNKMNENYIKQAMDALNYTDGENI